MGPLISAGQRETVASFVLDDAPVAIRGSAPDGPGYWFPPTVLTGRRPRRPGGPRGDLRPGGRGASRSATRPRAVRLANDSDLRPVGLDLDPRRRPRPAGRPGAGHRATCRSTPTPRSGCDPVRRLQAVRRRRELSPTPSSTMHRAQERVHHPLTAVLDRRHTIAADAGTSSASGPGSRGPSWRQAGVGAARYRSAAGSRSLAELWRRRCSWGRPRWPPGPRPLWVQELVGVELVEAPALAEPLDQVDLGDPEGVLQGRAEPVLIRWVSVSSRGQGGRPLDQVDGDDRVHRRLHGHPAALALPLAAVAVADREQRPLDVHAQVAGGPRPASRGCPCCRRGRRGPARSGPRTTRRAPPRRCRCIGSSGQRRRSSRRGGPRR